MTRVTVPIELIIQLAIGIVFGFSVFGKIRQPKQFMDSVRRYGLLPSSIAPGFGFLVIAGELFLCICHMAGLYLHLAVRFGIFLLTLFLFALSVNLARHNEIPCHCFHETEILSSRSLCRVAFVLFGELLLAQDSGPLAIARSRVMPSEQAYVILLLIGSLTTLSYWGLGADASRVSHVG